MKYKARPQWLGSKIYATTPALASLKTGDLLRWRLADAHPLGSRREAIALTHAGNLVGYLEDRYVGPILKAKTEYHVHVTIFKRRRGLRWAVVRFYPRKPVAAQPEQPRLPYA